MTLKAGTPSLDSALWGPPFQVVQRTRSGPFQGSETRAIPGPLVPSPTQGGSETGTTPRLQPSGDTRRDTDSGSLRDAPQGPPGEKFLARQGPA